MMIKVFGSFLIVFCCGGVGFHTAASYRKEIDALWQLLRVLEYMENELQYRLTPLPELCRNAAQNTSGALKTVLLSLCEELEGQLSPDVQCCMYAVLQRFPDISPRLKKALQQFGNTLGRFDVEGQLRAMNSVAEFIRSELCSLQKNQTTRIRSYQTLGLCAGAALAILLI